MKRFASNSRAYLHILLTGVLAVGCVNGRTQVGTHVVRLAGANHTTGFTIEFALSQPPTPIPATRSSQLISVNRRTSLPIPDQTSLPHASTVQIQLSNVGPGRFTNGSKTPFGYHPPAGSVIGPEPFHPLAANAGFAGLDSGEKLSIGPIQIPWGAQLMIGEPGAPFHGTGVLNTLELGIEVLSGGPEHSRIRVYRHFHYGLNVAPLGENEEGNDQRSLKIEINPLVFQGSFFPC